MQTATLFKTWTVRDEKAGVVKVEIYKLEENTLGNYFLVDTSRQTNLTIPLKRLENVPAFIWDSRIFAWELINQVFYREKSSDWVETVAVNWASKWLASYEPSHSKRWAGQ